MTLNVVNGEMKNLVCFFKPHPSPLLLGEGIILDFHPAEWGKLRPE